MLASQTFISLIQLYCPRYCCLRFLTRPQWSVCAAKDGGTMTSGAGDIGLSMAIRRTRLGRLRFFFVCAEERKNG